MSQQDALLVALNALQAIDEDHPYPIAKHAIEQINKVFAQSENPLDIADRAYFAVKQSGISEIDAAQQQMVDEIKRLTDLNRQLVDAAKALGAADDVAEWDNAWSKIAKLFKENG